MQIIEEEAEEDEERERERERVTMNDDGIYFPEIN